MNIDQLLISFSDQAKHILVEVESLYGSEVYWHERPDLEGDLCALSNTTFPAVLYRSESVLNEGACVHELLHLRLRKLGFPLCEKIDPEEDNNWRDHTIAMLDNIFQHAIIFPVLVTLGYDPYVAEETGTIVQLRKVSEDGFPSPEIYPSLRSSLALMHARAHVDCRSPEVLALCDSVFSSAAFSACKLTGTKFLDIVRAYANNDIDTYRVGLRESVDLLQETQFIRVTSSPECVNIFNEVERIIQQTYKTIHDHWYAGLRDMRPAIVRVTLEVRGNSGYVRDDDTIYIRLFDGNLSLSNVLDPESKDWPDWKPDLVHEMLHEYQYKVPMSPSPEGIRMFELYQRDEQTPKIANHISGFSGPGHDASFYTALAKWSHHFGYTPEELMRRQLV